MSTLQIDGPRVDGFLSTTEKAMQPDCAKDGARSCPGIEVALLTGGADKPYALGLASALVARGISLDFIGSNEVNGPELHSTPQVRFLNLRGDQRRDVTRARKVFRVMVYYARLIRYAARARPKVFHILWNNTIEFFDRTALMLYYKMLGRKIVLTAHNVNTGKRDGNDSALNRLTLRVQYRVADHIFVHTNKMKNELGLDFGVPPCKVTVIPFGINNSVPVSALTRDDARRMLGIGSKEKTMLFFGNIAPYKGLEYLISALARLAPSCKDYRLLIAGCPKGCAEYWDDIQQRIAHSGIRGYIMERNEYIPDEQTEWYFKAADVLILPYSHIFQSGVLFLAYSFGLPVIASDVGSLKEDIVEGKTGFVCKPRDPVDLAKVIKTYFSGDLFRNLETRRGKLRDYANDRYSWSKVGEITGTVYAELLQE